MHIARSYLNTTLRMPYARAINFMHNLRYSFGLCLWVISYASTVQYTCMHILKLFTSVKLMYSKSDECNSVQ